MRRVDAVVVGGGVMGAAAARALAGLGREVVLLERFGAGHDRGSSHGASRVFRCSYADPQFVRMALDSIPLWKELEAESGRDLLALTGGIDLGEGAQLVASALAACGVDFELSDGPPDRRWPGLDLPAEGWWMWQPGSVGRVAAAAAVEAFMASAVARGAEVLWDRPAISLRSWGAGAEVVTPDEGYRADVAVVTAGAWSRGLLAEVGIDLPVRVTRETPMYFPLRDGAEPPPVVLVEWTSPLVYALPTPGLGVKSGEHKGGPEVDPDRPGGPDAESVRRVSRWMAARVPAVEPTPHIVETCLYTSTADDAFVLERRGPFVIGSACSGHGFKFAPLIGRRLAELATVG